MKDSVTVSASTELERETVSEFSVILIVEARYYHKYDHRTLLFQEMLTYVSLLSLKMTKWPCSQTFSQALTSEDPWELHLQSRTQVLVFLFHLDTCILTK